MSGKILVIRSADGESTFIETIPATRGEQKALILNDAQVEMLIRNLSAYHNGEVRRVTMDIESELERKVTR